MKVLGTALMFLLALESGVAQAPATPATPGQALFEGRGRCLTCHSVNEQGALTARDLSWIGLLRTPDSLRRAVTDTSIHPAASSLSTGEVDELVTYLRTLRKLWALEPRERTRDIAPPTENAAFFSRA